MATIEIDQSGKWEAPTHTVIGVCIGKKIYSALITQKTKSTVQSILGKFDQEKSRSKKKLIIRMFTYSIFLTIGDITREGDVIIIDNEYQGNESMIRDLLIHLFNKFKGMKFGAKTIMFEQIGRDSLAHAAAYQTFTYGRSPDRQLSFEDYHSILDKTIEIRKKALLRRKKNLNRDEKR